MDEKKSIFPLEGAKQVGTVEAGFIISDRAKNDVANGKGTKDDFGKVDLTHFDPYFKAEVCKVMMAGAAKYKRANWQMSLEPNRILAALERHVDEMKKNLEFDNETGLRHSAHIGCNAMFLNFYERHNNPVKTEHDKG